MSPEKLRATKLTLNDKAKEIGFKGVDKTPLGVLLVTKPGSLVG